MIDIKINITNKIANAIGTPFIVCGNSDYTVTFTFDAEWGAYQEKTARFFFVSDGIEQYIDVLFSGNTCNAPVLPNIEKVLIGVYTGNLRTTTGAEVRCKRSILFGGKVHEPPTTEDVYNEILEIVGKKLGTEGGTVTGDYFKDGNTFIHEGNLDLLDETDNFAITKTATGSAISIFPAGAPIPQLILRGKTTQDGTPTPDAPVPLVSVGDSGSFEVCIKNSNLLETPKNTSITSSGLTLTFNSDASVTFSGNNTSRAVIYRVLTNFQLKKGFTYYLSGVPTGISEKLTIQLVDPSEYKLYAIDEGAGGTYTPTEDVLATVRIYVTSSTTNISGVTIYPMLATSDMEYVEPNNQYLTMPYTLRSVGDVKDVVDFARGMRTPRFAEVDLGTLNWDEANNGKQMSSGSILGQVLRPINNDTNAIVLCSSYRVDNANNIWNGKNDKSIGINTSGTVVVCDSNYTNATEFKNAMSGVILQYALATPIETPLTETELNAYRQLYTNKGNTTILSECEDTEITYYINRPNAQAIGNIHTQINKDYFKLQQAIISLGGN